MNAPPSPLFRKAALDRLSSPEELDAMVRVTSPAGWIALLALVGLLALALAWSIFGSVPTRVVGSAILIKTGGVEAIVAPSSGLITEMTLRVGETIRSGQRIARISQPGLADELSQLRAHRAEQRAKAASTELLLRQKRATLGSNLEVLRRRLDSQKQLLADGLVTSQAVLATQQQIEEALAQLKQLDIEKIDQGNQLADLDRRVESAQARLALNTDVVTFYSGRVLEIKQDKHGMVQAGSPILVMELDGDAINDLEVVAFVSSLDGKKVRPGMEIQVAPSTVKREDYGYMLGRVASVAEFPSTQQGMMRVLQNARLAEQLASGGAPIQVNARLLPDTSTESGFKWTSPGGPPLRIESGTLAQVNITVRTQRPISLVIPLLREFTGI